MLADCSDVDVSQISEVSPDAKVMEIDESEEPTGVLTTLAEEYVESLGAYCVASRNC